MMTEHGDGVAVVHRAMDDQHNALVAHGRFNDLLKAYLDHAGRWDRDSDPLMFTIMSQALAVACLHVSCRPRDEILGWTLSIQKPPMNFFFGADAERGWVTGRGFKDNVEQHEDNRLFVQSRRRRGKTSQTMINVLGLDVPGIFEQYHRRSEQQPARFFDFGDGRFAMIQGLPGIDTEWLEGLDSGAVTDYLEIGQSPIEQREFVFNCGCDVDRIRHVVRSAYDNDVSELFLENSSIEVECPRCGRIWVLQERDLA